VVRFFTHHQPAALGRLLDRHPAGRLAVVVCDGFCPQCGAPAPLGAYLSLVKQAGGLLFLDDTQALGILGSGPGPGMPYGRDGGGTCRFFDLADPAILIGASAAKGFGAPLAVLVGAGEWIDFVRANAETRLHSSPPSLAAIQAAQEALAMNESRGRLLRAGLAWRVRFFRSQLMQRELEPHGGMFPVQSIRLDSPDLAARVYRALVRKGMRPVLSRGHQPDDLRISFLLTLRHSRTVLSSAAAMLDAVFRMEAQREGKEVWR
jgi:8-amino-7-oxononanoate synthase